MEKRNLKESYEIVRLQPSGIFYADPEAAPEMPLGQSRVGGPIIDLPIGFEHPADLFFVAQLDLEWLTQKCGRTCLPENGWLFFFYNLLDDGKAREVSHVHYFSGTRNSLHRVVRPHMDLFWEGVAIVDGSLEEELLRDRFDGKDWDYFAGMEKTKIGGIPSNPQWHEGEAAAALDGGRRTLLLQVGEDINDEGCLLFFIDDHDLEKRNFDSCTAVWGQT